MSSSFSSQLLVLADRLQQLKDALATELLTESQRKHIDRQVVIIERALARALTEEHERRQTEGG